MQRLGERLPLLEAHDSLCLLRSAFAIPKVLYILRTAPCFLSPSLDRFDSLQRSLIESICNIQLSDASWLQASLPINGVLLCWHHQPTWLQLLAALPSHRHSTRRHDPFPSIHPDPGSGQMGKMGRRVRQAPHRCGRHQTEDLRHISR